MPAPGYLSYSNRHADLLFELVSRRYEHNSTIVTTNRPFAEWREVFPNAACVVSLVDRLVHNGCNGGESFFRTPRHRCGWPVYSRERERPRRGEPRRLARSRLAMRFPMTP
jgi:IstB-like ATP binding protein